MVHESMLGQHFALSPLFSLTGPVIGTTHSPLGLKTSLDQVNYWFLEFTYFVIKEEIN